MVFRVEGRNDKHSEHLGSMFEHCRKCSIWGPCVSLLQEIESDLGVLFLPKVLTVLMKIKLRLPAKLNSLKNSKKYTGLLDK